jgi:hypothetical protein
MNLANMGLVDLVGVLLGFVFTLFIFSYILGDNPLFRLALYIFIGVAAGYAVVMAWYNVIWPQLLLPLVTGSSNERLLLLFPLLLSGLLLMRISPRLAGWGSPVIAYLVGVGVATAIGGAVLGTLIPQVQASINQFDLNTANQNGNNVLLYMMDASVILVATITTLIFFHFGVKSHAAQAAQATSTNRGVVIESLAWVGQVFISITFGALFAGVYTAALTALVERMYSGVKLVQFLLPLFTPK